MGILKYTILQTILDFNAWTSLELLLSGSLAKILGILSYINQELLQGAWFPSIYEETS